MSPKLVLIPILIACSVAMYGIDVLTGKVGIRGSVDTEVHLVGAQAMNVVSSSVNKVKRLLHLGASDTSGPDKLATGPPPRPVDLAPSPSLHASTTPATPARITPPPTIVQPPSVTGGTEPNVSPNAPTPKTKAKIVPTPKPAVPTPGIIPIIGDSIGIRLVQNGLMTQFGENWKPMYNMAVNRTILNPLPQKSSVVENDPPESQSHNHPRRNGYDQAFAMRYGLHDAHAVVVELGTNPDNAPAVAIRKLARRIHAHVRRGTPIYWVNSYNGRAIDRSIRFNAELAKASHDPRYGFKVINWYRIASQKRHRMWFQDDRMRLHPNIGGARALIRAIVSSVTHSQ